MDVRVFRSDDVAEVFVSATPDPAAGSDGGADIFSAIRRALDDAGARPFQERVFVCDPAAADDILAARAECYGDLDDGLAPALLHVAPGCRGPLVGVQMHAVSTPGGLGRIDLDGSAGARIARKNGRGFVAVTGLAAPEAGSAPEQAREMFLRSYELLRRAGGDMRRVARTWLWLGDILSWYDAFNDVRTRFFHECGLVNGSPDDAHLPASTGIGIGPAPRGACAMDLVAVVGERPGIRLHNDCGRQRSAYNYGSAFSRAAVAPTPAGQAAYVSGTASIDAEGRTTHVGDSAAQTDETVANVRAVLNDLDFDDGDVVQAIVYCKTPEIEREFLARADAPPWPHITAVAPVCRDDLSIEIEATAVRGLPR